MLLPLGVSSPVAHFLAQNPAGVTALSKRLQDSKERRDENEGWHSRGVWDRETNLR